jgi:hypothetical protein
MWFSREADHFDFPVQQFEHREHLLGLLDVATLILFVVEDQNRGANILEIGDRRAPDIGLRVGPWQPFEFSGQTIANVGTAHKRFQVNH